MLNNTNAAHWTHLSVKAINHGIGQTEHPTKDVQGIPLAHSWDEPAIYYSRMQQSRAKGFRRSPGSDLIVPAPAWLPDHLELLIHVGLPDSAHLVDLTKCLDPDGRTSFWAC